MGIQGLMRLICDYSPSSVKDHAIKNYFGEFTVDCPFICVGVALLAEGVTCLWCTETSLFILPVHRGGTTTSCETLMNM